MWTSIELRWQFVRHAIGNGSVAIKWIPNERRFSAYRYSLPTIFVFNVEQVKQQQNHLSHRPQAKNLD